jgi:hypothetical protein
MSVSSRRELNFQGWRACFWGTKMDVDSTSGVEEIWDSFWSNFDHILETISEPKTVKNGGEKVSSKREPFWGSKWLD